ncbi:MAG: hypothetical protein ACI4VX_00600 [Succinivibrionaceae bacterium]
MKKKSKASDIMDFIRNKNHYSNLIKHPAQPFVDQLWHKIEADCYYNFSDLPAHYSQLKKVKIIQLVQPSSPYDYKLNKIFYPNDINSREALLNLSNNFIHKVLEEIIGSDEEPDNDSNI